MNKRDVIIFALISLFALSCSSLRVVNNVPSTPKVIAPDESMKANPPEVPSGAITFKVLNASPSQADRIMKAGEIMNRIIKTQCFHDYMMSRKMIQTNGRKNEEVVNHVSSLFGRISVSMYFRKLTSAMAYAEKELLKLNLNAKYFGASTNQCTLASTLGHEAIGHILGGYSHDFKYSPARDYSVPYSIGFAIAACCE